MKHCLFFLLLTLILFESQSKAQIYTSFGPEIPVTINGLNFDAMEPFISPDEQTLFFNSLNSGGNTNLYFAERINDSTFNYIGLVNGTFDPNIPHLDAVPSIDSSNFFVWVSLRDYPNTLQNLISGQWQGNGVNTVRRVNGDFYISQPGYLIMDAALNYDGSQLIYCNALFNSCPNALPCSARLGISEKVNDSTYNKISNTDSVLALVNDSNFLVYAPQLSSSGLELYFTRLQPSGINTEICVSVRNTLSDAFSLPQVLVSNNGFVPEAPSLTANEQKLYYHKKNMSGVNRIFLRYRDLPSGKMKINKSHTEIVIGPNPCSNELKINGEPIQEENFKLTVYNLQGLKILEAANANSISVENLEPGIYFLKITMKKESFCKSFIKQSSN